MSSIFTGNLTITNTNTNNANNPTGQTSPVNTSVTFQGSNPSNVSVPPLPPSTFPVSPGLGITDHVTSTPGAATGTYDQKNGQMNLTVVITLSDTLSPSLLKSNPENVTFVLSTSGTLSMSSAGSAAFGQPLNAQGCGSIRLVGSANVPTLGGGSVGVGLVLVGTLDPAPPGPACGVPTTVPFIVGLQYEKAVALVNAAGLTLNVNPAYTDTDAEWNKVLSQNPAGGSPSFKGDQVTISVGTIPYQGYGGGGHQKGEPK